ncbi:MAG TPA: hypothetical protein VKW08_26925 [Xanthobacteraceae bacterium]|jgi:hypothetical protein|nr:hypothetical protein [Xanthobacteraceae bacterium]
MRNEPATLTHVGYRAPATRPLTTRSRVTNGKTLFAEGGDMRAPWSRRLRDILDLHLADIGGVDHASEAERSILRRAATLTVELERLEARFAEGPSSNKDLETYQRTSNTLRRLLESVGLKRRPRDITPPRIEDLLVEGDAP